MWHPAIGTRGQGALCVLDMRLALIVALALLAGMFAYQAPASAAIPVGWLGDRLFVIASEGSGAADQLAFYGDELTPDALSGRSRWTRQGAQAHLAGLGGGALMLTVRARGWPVDALNGETRQPDVVVAADDTVIGQFMPTDGWDEYRLTIPADTRRGPDLTLTFRASHVFTSTQTYNDPRPKGIRIETIAVHAISDGPYLPAPAPIAWLVISGVVWFLMLALLVQRPDVAFIMATLLVSALAVALAAARIWTVALLPIVAVAGASPLLWFYRGAITRYPLRLARRYAYGAAPGYGLLAATFAWLGAGIARGASPLSGLDRFWESFPDSLIYTLLAAGLLLLALIYGRNGLPRIAERIVSALGSPRGAALLLALFLAVWVGYLTSVVLAMPYVGHADYADNAVVARNLLAGRGWTVDYVTQFYRLYEGVTRPQETWPLLQPVWVALSFAVFGINNWAAKLPNLLFMILLALAVFRTGTHLWDRRVGLIAALVLITSHLYFKLAIYVTNDLAFTLFAFGALAMLYAGETRRGAATSAAEDHPPAATRQTMPPENLRFPGWKLAGHLTSRHRQTTRRATWLLLLSGVLTGLMLLQKPGSGGLIALGMGLWLLASRVRPMPATIVELRRRIAPVAAWGVIAFALLTPYLARNIITFGTPYYSTESKDAWVLEYTTWDQIYAVYTTEAGLSGTGPPDRSWILRWGFDRTLLKLERQVRALRDYLIPSWNRLPAGIGEYWFGRADKQRLLFEAGAWLALLGVAGAAATRWRLVSLLGAAFVPYTLFLIVYWHTSEERYWVVLMPWLALFAAAALWQIYDRIATLADGRWAPAGLLVAMALTVAMIRPSWPDIAEKVRDEPQLYSADLDMYAWLGRNTEPGAVIMTRNPWQLNWHSNRPALMIPYTTDRETLLWLARHYRVRYLVLDTLQRPEPEVQRMLDALVADSALGFREVYRTPVYRADFRGVTKELVAVAYELRSEHGALRIER